MSLHSILMNGSDEELEEQMEAEHALVVDHRSEEEEVLGEITRFLKEFSFEHSGSNNGGLHFDFHFNEKSSRGNYASQPHNCFRLLLDVEKLISPEADIRVYAPSMDGDTHVFVIQKKDFWDQFDAEAKPERKKIFQPISFLNQAWKLDKPATPQKAWWRFWK